MGYDSQNNPVSHKARERIAAEPNVAQRASPGFCVACIPINSFETPMRTTPVFDSTLDETTAPANPLLLFTQWYELAARADYIEPSAMCLATTDSNGRPSARMVLLKGFGEAGFDFYTNYLSRKSSELLANPHAALVFYWDTLHRQIRIEGTVKKVPAADSDRYFASRPRGSQIGAIASHQSRSIASREQLEAAYKLKQAELGEAPATRPDYWGGFRLMPARLEFWQGRPDRLHDRLHYTRNTGPSPVGWSLERLQP